MNVSRWYRIFLFAILSGVLLQCKTTESTAQQKETEPGKELSTSELRAFQYAFYDGNRAKILGNYEEAKSYFEKALSINPTSGVTKYELARLLAENGQYGAAIPYAEGAYRSDRSNVWYGQFLAQLYAETGKWDKSVEVIREAIENDPGTYENYFNLGSLLTAQGQYKEALELYDQVEEQFGKSDEITMQRQMIYLEKGDPQKALEEANKLISQNPEEVRYLGIKAEILEKMGRQEEAVAIYRRMLEMEPDNGLVLIALYENAREKGDAEMAEKYLMDAFASPELNIDVKINILLNLMSDAKFLTDPGFVLALAEKLEVAHPANAKSYAIQGDIYFALKEAEMARKKFRKAVEIDPNRPPIWQQILALDSRLGDFEAMKEESDEALELFPQQPAFYLFNGIALLQMDRTEDAVEMLTTGKNLVIDDNMLLAQFHSSLGDAYNELGKHKKSDEAYEKALRYDPNNVIVLNNYAYYLALRGDSLEQAEAMAKKANDLNPDEAGFQDTYAWVLYKRGNYKNALFWIQEALNNGGDADPIIIEHHGDILFKLGKVNDAVSAWQMALNLGGDTDRLSEKIGQNSETKTE